MEPKMFDHDQISLPEIKAKTTNGVRLYETPEGNKYPSITTVLSVRNKQGLFEWRKRMLLITLQELLLQEVRRFMLCVKITSTMYTLTGLISGRSIRNTFFLCVYLTNLKKKLFVI